MSEPAGVAARLGQMVGEGLLRPDPIQRQAADALDALGAAIVKHQSASKSGALGWLFARGRDRKAAPLGLYFHGGVGRGKTMLMDLFFQTLPIAQKRRAHFNDFMADVHDRIGAQRAARKSGASSEDDPIPPVARALAAQAWVLCFDEFAVTDIADAMILSRLFSALWAEGVVLVATSNVAPDDLYRDGLNRALFLPFVAQLRKHCTVMPLDGGVDYRMLRLSEVPSYLAPLNDETRALMDEAWNAATAGQIVKPATIEVKGRAIPVPLASTHAARFSFEDLCAQPLAARDYLAIVERYSTLFVENVPVLKESQRNEAKRFILLVDTLYDRHVRVVFSAEALPEQIYVARNGTEAFEFARTISRLHEMQSAEWAKDWERRQTGFPKFAATMAN
ncbi:MAG: AFG1 family ATPase [Methylobacterium mesophilicum]|nr:AFG1 family ATPase [Methylobacterium mesophilicum]